MTTDTHVTSCHLMLVSWMVFKDNLIHSPLSAPDLGLVH